MTLHKRYLWPRILIGLLALVMAAFTLPAYGNPVSNPGLASLTGEAVSLGGTAGAFLGRQLTLITIALIGVIAGQRALVLIGGFAMLVMNGHDAFFMGLMGGASQAAIAGLVFAIIAAIAMVLVWRNPAAE